MNIKNNLLRIMLITIIFTLMFNFVVNFNYSFAAVTTIDGVDINTDKDVTVTGITSAANSVIGIIQTVGILIAVGVIMVLGIKYMMGSAEEKAEYKKVFIPYLIGAILLFAASALAESIYNLAVSINV